MEVVVQLGVPEVVEAVKRGEVPGVEVAPPADAEVTLGRLLVIPLATDIEEEERVLLLEYRNEHAGPPRGGHITQQSFALEVRMPPRADRIDEDGRGGYARTCCGGAPDHGLLRASVGVEDRRGTHVWRTGRTRWRVRHLLWTIATGPDDFAPYNHRRIIIPAHVRLFCVWPNTRSVGCPHYLLVSGVW